MSVLNLDREVFPIPCECGHKLQETFGRLKTNPNLKCPKCGTDIRVNADELKRGLKKLEDIFRKFR